LKTPRLIKGIDHINFACSDMGKTLEFWEGIGVKCTLNLRLHDPERNHFFFAMGEGIHESSFSYWYWHGVKLSAAPEHNDHNHAGFYHLAFHVDTEEELEDMYALLNSKGVTVSEITGRHMFDKSFYFRDPDGIQFEFACPVLDLKGDVDHDGNGTIKPLSSNVTLGSRRLDGPVHFETKYK
jgi:catechol 2,3-dioxygenase-like lactoylglutathione lyase family enzyme